MRKKTRKGRKPPRRKPPILTPIEETVSSLFTVSPPHFSSNSSSPGSRCSFMYFSTTAHTTLPDQLFKSIEDVMKEVKMPLDPRLIKTASRKHGFETLGLKAVLWRILLRSAKIFRASSRLRNCWTLSFRPVGGWNIAWNIGFKKKDKTGCLHFSWDISMALGRCRSLHPARTSGRELPWNEIW